MVAQDVTSRSQQSSRADAAARRRRTTTKRHRLQIACAGSQMSLPGACHKWAEKCPHLHGLRNFFFTRCVLVSLVTAGGELLSTPSGSSSRICAREIQLLSTPSGLFTDLRQSDLNTRAFLFLQMCVARLKGWRKGREAAEGREGHRRTQS